MTLNDKYVDKKQQFNLYFKQYEIECELNWL